MSDLVDIAAGISRKDVDVAGSKKGSEQANKQHLQHWHGSHREQRPELHPLVFLEEL